MIIDKKELGKHMLTPLTIHMMLLVWNWRCHMTKQLVV